MVCAHPVNTVSCGLRQNTWGRMFFYLTLLFHTDSVLCLPTHLYNQWYLSNLPYPKLGRVAIAIHKQLPFFPTDHMFDPNCSFMFLKGTIFGRKFTFAAVCALNTQQLTFLDFVLNFFSPFRERQLVLRGAFNVSPDPLLDTSLGHSTHSFIFLKH